MKGEGGTTSACIGDIFGVVDEMCCSVFSVPFSKKKDFYILLGC